MVTGFGDLNCIFNYCNKDSQALNAGELKGESLISLRQLIDGHLDYKC